MRVMLRPRHVQASLQVALAGRPRMPQPHSSDHHSISHRDPHTGTVLFQRIQSLYILADARCVSYWPYARGQRHHHPAGRGVGGIAARVASPACR